METRLGICATLKTEIRNNPPDMALSSVPVESTVEAFFEYHLLVGVRVPFGIETFRVWLVGGVSTVDSSFRCKSSSPMTFIK